MCRADKGVLKLILASYRGKLNIFLSVADFGLIIESLSLP